MVKIQAILVKKVKISQLAEDKHPLRVKRLSK